MTGSIAEPRPCPSQRPVLRRLVDILPAQEPAPPEPPQLATSAPATVDPAASMQVERLLRAAVEILSGQRPARQLSAVLHPEVLTHLTALQEVMGHLKPRVRKVLIRSQTPRVLEAVAVVALTTGVRALAARFEEHLGEGRSRWRCTALQLRLTAGDLATPRPRRP